MIRVVFTSKRVTAWGHADYAPKGQDVVCAAVSALLLSLEATLEETDNLAEAIVRSGYATIAAQREDRALDMARCGLAHIAARYPDHVRMEGEK